MKLVRLALLITLSLVLILGVGPSVQAREGSDSIDLSATVALVISDIFVEDIGYYSATISWQTNASAISQVFYDTVEHGDKDDYAQSDEDNSLVTEHSIALSGLSPRTTYHYRVRSVVTIDNVEFTAISEDHTFTTSGPSGGGGGGFGITRYLRVDLWGEKFKTRVTSAGEVRADLEAVSIDEMVTLYITKGVLAQTEDEERLRKIEVLPMADPPPLPENGHIIGLAYDFIPAGATFDTPIELEIRYDPSQVPDGIDEKDLLIAYHDEETGEWIELDDVVDTVGNTITAKVSHFTHFAIFGFEVAVPPVPPAKFTVTSLSILPSEVYVAERVKITVKVANTGGEAGSYEVTLKINGVVEATREITVHAGLSKEVTFTIVKNIAGSYSVDVNGLSGSFTVKAAPPPPPPPPPSQMPPTPEVKPFNWPLVGGIIAGVVVVGLGVFFWIRRSAREG